MKYNVRERYFDFVIPAWNWAAKEMDRINCMTGSNKLKTENDRSQCNTMVKTFYAEYIRVACEKGEKLKNIEEDIHNYKIDEWYCKENQVWVDEKSKNIYYEFRKNEYLFWMKYRIHGITIAAAILLKRIIPVDGLYYPIIIEGRQGKRITD